ncbi:hypothetical protein DQ04_00061130 [Trypanosoma grayi]|uniref:hypothetical protein n=1 Tax=Trypanosoma grayi TaxID=71804 RepID=UPI0004F46BB5|nr:hypothetical protein DQ04_00061130 [Trypanosoma grayi]KEG15475.1 hypothetical protein DQ04_00061130 [Trypanosoma grayi]
MNELISSEESCRRQIGLVEDSTFWAQSLLLLRTIGYLMGEENMMHYISLMRLLTNSSNILQSYRLFLKRKEVLLATFSAALDDAAEIHEAGCDLRRASSQTSTTSLDGAKTKIFLSRCDSFTSFFQNYYSVRLKLFGLYGVEHSRIQKELMLVIHSLHCTDLARMLLSPSACDHSPRILAPPEEFYGLVVSDGRLLNRGGHTLKEHYYQVRVIQSLAPAFPLVRSGDVILSINKRSVATLEGARAELKGHPKTLELLVLRQKKAISVTVTV